MCGRRVGRRATQDGLDARQQNVNVEGFGDIVIGAGFEANDLIELATPCCDRDDRHRPQLPGFAEGFETVRIGQPDVDENEVGRFCAMHSLPEQLERICRIGGCTHAKSCLLEVVRKAAPHQRVIVYDQYVSAHARRLALSRPSVS